MRARIEQVDQQHRAYVYEVDKAEIDSVAEHCKALQSCDLTGTADVKLAARVPDFMVMKYINDNGITFREFMQSQDHIHRLLNDPALAHFRVWKGRVG